MVRQGYEHVTQQDYESIAGPDWPAWQTFCQDLAVADFVYEEIDLMLSRPVEFQHPSLCVLPFYALEFWAGAQSAPGRTFCCLVPDGTDRQSVKQDMLAGRRPESCSACWRLEDQGLVSDRQIKNRSIDTALLQDIQGMLSGQPQQTAIHQYKIDSNNICNSTCAVCDSTYSTAWAQLERTHGVPARPAWKLLPETTDDAIDYAHATTVGFRGGEPFLSDNTWHVLEQLAQANNTACVINFTTNGSIALTAEQRNLLARFDTVGFNFSIDGVGAVFEYVRYPLQWTDLEQSIKYCREAGHLITASYTISNLNILYHAQTRQWFDDQGIAYSLNPVYHPSHFRPGALPLAVKDHIRQQQAQDPVIEWLLATHDPQDDLDHAVFLQKISEQDTWKGIRMQDYLPELSKLLG